MDQNIEKAENILRKYGLTPNSDKRVEIKKLLEYEIENYNNGSSEYFRVLSAMLFCIGKVEDSILIFRAKILNMDVGSMIDTEFLFGAGFEETFNFLLENIKTNKNNIYSKMYDFIFDYNKEWFDKDEVIREYKQYYTNYFLL